MKRLSFAFLAWGLLSGILFSLGSAEEGRAKGYRLYEATAATVNGKVIFLSDVVREVCLAGCGAFPGDEPADRSLSAARERLIADTLVGEEEEKLELGPVDNVALRETAARAMDIVRRCPSPCAKQVSDDQVRDYVARRLSVQEFLRKRVSVFIDVNEEEVQREVQRRISRLGLRPEDVAEETVRKELLEEKAAREIRNWFDRAMSKSRILRSPLEER